MLDHKWYGVFKTVDKNVIITLRIYHTIFILWSAGIMIELILYFIIFLCYSLFISHYSTILALTFKVSDQRFRFPSINPDATVL